jgi:hypothetical protein
VAQAALGSRARQIAEACAAEFMPSRAFEPFSSLAGITGTTREGQAVQRPPRAVSLDERNERAPRNPAGANKRMVR